MKKYCNLFILLFALFIPKVYAFTYDIGTNVENTSNDDKTLYEIKVSLKDVVGSDYGIGSCNLNILFHGDVKLESSVRSLESWTLTTGKFYLLDTGNPVKKSSDMLIIPVKVTGVGNVELSDIECFDDMTSVVIDNKIINLKYEEEVIDKPNGNSNSSNNNHSGNNSNNDNSNDGENDIKNSNADLSDIILSDGNIVFDSSITEYYIDVTDFDSLTIEPVSVSSDVVINIDKGDGKVVINVEAEDGTEKIYTIFVNENLNHDTLTEDDSNNKYIPIFIGIIVILVLINIFRIINNKKNK